ncbi:ATP-binding protein [Streptacidiphilus sp. EB129]|uniref:ATP-binding protein n=1 Tax=Streptacidiphilus sp. EB129 TaxID=3156262 RepID=UPI003511134F
MHSLGFVVRFTIRSRPYLVAAVRRRVLVHLHCRGVRLDPDTSAVLELLVSELVTNAVVHARGTRVAVTLYGWGNRTLVDVHDSSTQLPRVRRAEDGAEAGRGLALIAHLAYRYGWAPTKDGKHCWAEVRHSPDPERSAVPPTQESAVHQEEPQGRRPERAARSLLPLRCCPASSDPDGESSWARDGHQRPVSLRPDPVTAHHGDLERGQVVGRVAVVGARHCDQARQPA